MTVAQPKATAATAKTPPNIVRRERALVVLLNICGIDHDFSAAVGEANGLPEKYLLIF